MPRKNIMLCYPFEEKRFNKWNTQVLVQPKLDGVRCRALLRGNEEPLLLSSEENILNFSVPHVVDELDKLQPSFIRHGIYELDGELYSHELSFDQIVSRTGRTTNIHEDHTDIQYHIFDHVCEETPFVDRISAVESAIIHSEILRNCVRVVPERVARCVEDIKFILDEYYSLGYEGIIVRHPAYPYERKRSTGIMKWKPRKSDTYTIIGYEEEKSIHGELKGTLGSLTVQDQEGRIFSVGTGFTQKSRELLWEIRYGLPGQFCKILYQHTTPSGVPRFPVFSTMIYSPGEKEPNER